MIVTLREAVAIESGRQTEFRLPLNRRAPKVGSRVSICVRIPNPQIGYIDGEPKLEQITRCYILILNVGSGFLSSVTERDAKRLGYRSRYLFLQSFDGLSGETPVHEIHFELDRRHIPRFLSQRIVAGKQGDYVTNPTRGLRGEPEAVPSEILVMFSQDARLRYERRHAELVDLIRLAREQQVNVAKELESALRYRERPATYDFYVEKIRSRLGIGLQVAI